jgi:hypothetical protein
MGNGATIHKMPLMNILALNGTTAPMTVLIHDCTMHMEEGRKKDAPYIVKLFEGKVLEYDPQLLFTDVFYFDGASNVQFVAPAPTRSTITIGGRREDGKSPRNADNDDKR